MFLSATTIMITSGLIVATLFTIGLIFSRLYLRASKETSFVRTGFGGQKVIMNGGALVFPVLHETIPVNMNTLRLAVNRANEQALITRDRMRVDVVTEFYVRVQPTRESIANAAQTLGQRTMHPQQLKDLVEGKFVDALRSVASEMTMEELHEKRIDFVQKVQQVVTEDILKNGLELESVSLTGLDQTSRDFFNPNNAFDAEGLTRLTAEIEQRRKIRNDIEQETEVLITEKNLEAEKKRLEFAKQEEYARLEQRQEIAFKRAQQQAEIATKEAEQQREADQARILAEQRVKEAQITAAREVEIQEIEKQKRLELQEQERQIVVAEKSKAQSEMEAQADQARALAIEAAEKVITAKENEIAERQKMIVLIEATKDAERQAIELKVAARAEKDAALDHAEAIRTEAQARADAEKIQAEAQKITFNVQAVGERAINEAKNSLSVEQVAMQIKLQLIENLDGIIRESVKPLENIDGIKIVQMTGFGDAAGNPKGDAAPNHGNASLADQVVNSALRYRAQAPLLDSLLNEIGLQGNDINGLTKALQSSTVASEVKETAEA